MYNKKHKLTNLVVHLYFFSENFCLLYDSEGRFRLHSIRDEEAKVLISLALDII